MNLSISNIGWAEKDDDIVYSMMMDFGFRGLEIAPTRIFTEHPYDDLERAGIWASCIHSQYGFSIPSMQSIWYGRTEKLFGTEKEQNKLLVYTRKAIRFAERIGCSNMVFGCPKNRSMPEGADLESVIRFFREVGDYAYDHHTVIALEPNPPIYNTNFINTTKEAIEIAKRVGSNGVLLNLDLGAMIENQELISDLRDGIELINHVHISEPGLKAIQRRKLHRELAGLLEEIDYKGYVSIEVGMQESIESIRDMMVYVKSVFHDY